MRDLVTTAFDVVGALCSAVAVSLFVLGFTQIALAVFYGGLVLLVWSWLWVGAPGVAPILARLRRQPKPQEGTDE